MTEAQGNAAGTIKGNILIVDDDPDFAEGLAEALDRSAYGIAIAHDPAEARRVLRQFDAQVALVDIRLGQESGVDLISDLRAARPGILCVMMTAYADLDNAIEALKKGAYDYLRKPLNEPGLFTTLNRCFGSLRSRQEKGEAKARLRESEKRYRSIFEAAANLITSVNGEGIVVECNHRVEDILGYKPEEIIGRPMTRIIHPDDHAGAVESLSEILTRGAAHNEQYGMIRKDGGVIGEASVSL